MSDRVLIVGIGRPGLGDDALGLVAAERLEEALAGAASVITDAGTGWDALHALGDAPHRPAPSPAAPVRGPGGEGAMPAAPRYDLLVLIDAGQADGSEPTESQIAGSKSEIRNPKSEIRGRWWRLRYPEDAEALARCPLRDTHTMSAVGLLEMAAALEMLPSETWVYAMAGEHFAPETGLSPAVAAAMDPFVAEIAAQVHDWLKQEAACGK